MSDFDPVEFVDEGKYDRKYDITTGTSVTFDKLPSPDLVAKVVELEELVSQLTVVRDTFQVVALVILGILAAAALGCTAWLLAVGVSAEAALAVFGLSNLSAGAVAGALTFGKQG